MKEIKILAIAPYDEMKIQLEQIAKQYENLSISVFVGDLENGLEIARSKFSGEYDVILSRGGTASLLEKLFPIPVVEIPISFYDILCALNLSHATVKNDPNYRSAIVGFKNITKNAHLLCEVLNYNLDVYTIEDVQMILPILQHVHQQGYNLILCDMITNTVAKKNGISTFLVNSGMDSICTAIEQAIKIATNHRFLIAENNLFKKILSKHKTDTVIFDERENIIFSTLNKGATEDSSIVLLLKPEISDTKYEQRKLIKSKKNVFYHITAEKFRGETGDYYTFFVSTKKTPSISIKNGITFQSSEQVEKTFSTSIYNFFDNTNFFNDYIKIIDSHNSPILVVSEIGSEKTQAVSCIYLNSTKKNAPLITINCSNISEKTFDFLINNVNSPVNDSGNTLVFTNIEHLDDLQFNTFTESVLHLDIVSKNQVFFTCTSVADGKIPQKAQILVESLNCLILKLPLLKEKVNNIPSLIGRYYNHLNGVLPQQIAGITPEGVKLLQDYDWPYNYMQFKRILHQMATNANCPIISASLVEETLLKEKNIYSSSAKSENSENLIDLTKTLAEIELEIIKRVLILENNNQTNAAKRLGISRATLWRTLKN